MVGDDRGAALKSWLVELSIQSQGFRIKLDKSKGEGSEKPQTCLELRQPSKHACAYAAHVFKCMRQSKNHSHSITLHTTINN